MRKAVRSLGILAAAVACCASATQTGLLSGSDLMVGYYGRPGAVSLGVLGQHSTEELVPILKARADEYAQVSGKKNVTPAFHLIYGLASPHPGRDEDFILNLPDEKVMEYVAAAQRHGFAVIIDSQLGLLTPAEAVKPALKFLKHPNVHLAIDPEFAVAGLEVPPGEVIGHISGEDVNQVQSAMTDYLRENDIKERKILIVHMFTNDMVEEKHKIKKFEQIDLVFNFDGHGTPPVKVHIYNKLYSADAAAKSAGGFKLFFRKDKPSMMTPQQVLGIDPVGRRKIDHPPKYINYQ
jgi:hypothetical protein